MSAFKAFSIGFTATGDAAPALSVSVSVPAVGQTLPPGWLHRRMTALAGCESKPVADDPMTISTLDRTRGVSLISTDRDC